MPHLTHCLLLYTNELMLSWEINLDFHYAWNCKTRRSTSQPGWSVSQLIFPNPSPYSWARSTIIPSLSGSAMSHPRLILFPWFAFFPTSSLLSVLPDVIKQSFRYAFRICCKDSWDKLSVRTNLVRINGKYVVWESEPSLQRWLHQDKSVSNWRQSLLYQDIKIFPLLPESQISFFSFAWILRVFSITL